jgi:hypothetical protein
MLAVICTPSQEKRYIPITNRKGRLLKTIFSCSPKERDAGSSAWMRLASKARMRSRTPKTHQYNHKIEITVQTTAKTRYACWRSAICEKTIFAKINDRMLPPMENVKRKLLRLVRSS